jgi:hypothetical protein
MRNAVFEVELNRGGRTHDTLQDVREESGDGMSELEDLEKARHLLSLLIESERDKSDE